MTGFPGVRLDFTGGFGDNFHIEMDNIEKLKEKVDNDPTSALFVPLAEEYRKAGQLDEAVEVLMAGIEHQPSYMSARVSLGKIYLQRGMAKEAEFEEVIHAIPDNLFAHRKLAEIYRTTGKTEKAIRQYRKLIYFNSSDEESHEMLKQLLAGGGPVKMAGEVDIGGAEIVEALEQEGGFAPGAMAEGLETFEAVTGGEEAPSGDFSLSLVENDTLGEGGDALEEDGGLLSAGFTEEGDAFTGSGNFGDFDVADGEVLDFPYATGGGDESGEAVDLAEGLETFGVEEAPGGMDFAGDEAAEVITIEDAAPLLGDGGIGGVETLDGDLSALAEASRAEDADVTRTDALIADGDYDGAMGVYTKLLEKNPDDREVLQRVVELKGLLKLLGKENELLVIRLEAFLEAVKRRRNELFGGT